MVSCVTLVSITLALICSRAFKGFGVNGTSSPEVTTTPTGKETNSEVTTTHSTTWALTTIFTTVPTTEALTTLSTTLGTTTEAPTTTPRPTCPPPIGVANAVQNNQGPFYVGSRLNYQCNDGFSMAGAPSAQECGHDGSWSGTAPVCSPIDKRPYYNNNQRFEKEDLPWWAFLALGLLLLLFLMALLIPLLIYCCCNNNSVAPFRTGHHQGSCSSCCSCCCRRTKRRTISRSSSTCSDIRVVEMGKKDGGGKTIYVDAKDSKQPKKQVILGKRKSTANDIYIISGPDGGYATNSRKIKDKNLKNNISPRTLQIVDETQAPTTPGVIILDSGDCRCPGVSYCGTKDKKIKEKSRVSNNLSENSGDGSPRTVYLTNGSPIGSYADDADTGHASPYSDKVSVVTRRTFSKTKSRPDVLPACTTGESPRSIVDKKKEAKQLTGMWLPHSHPVRDTAYHRNTSTK